MNLQEYYQYYLTLHKNPKTRLCHFMGQIFTLLYVGVVLYYKAWYYLLLAPLVVYPFAWSGHYFFEKNKPAAFHDPLKAKLSDWIMFKDILLGRIKIW